MMAARASKYTAGKRAIPPKMWPVPESPRELIEPGEVVDQQGLSRRLRAFELKRPVGVAEMRSMGTPGKRRLRRVILGWAMSGQLVRTRYMRHWGYSLPEEPTE